ncbi:centromere protein V [Trichoderma asperellum]|uniref:Centromere protein V n=1 Tax=Trichoderma asperellum TaxID=101201 RepID=A0A6V8QQH2_TRIAP|nr:centromere protein V [Trichoderma asperellum]
MAEAQDRPNRRTYQGSCHCGAFAYEIDLPELKTVIDCDCSFCSRKGNLYVLTSEEDNFRVVKGSEEGLTSYTFGPRNKIHKFCPKCATISSTPSSIHNTFLQLTKEACRPASKAAKFTLEAAIAVP